jgi:ABC-type nitrate/sulfonate/bicarbonate transport system ATPase subunit
MADFSIRNLSKIYDTQDSQVVALQNVSFEVADNEFVSIVGASGSGKSTLLNLVAGFERPTSGEILLDGKAIERPGPDRGVVFQQSALYPWLDVHGNVSFGLKLAANRGRGTPEKVEAIIERVGLAAFKKNLPSELSGGMRQRAAIASVLAIDPAVLLMDEPFGALDSLTRSVMQDFLLEIWESERKTVMLVTHDITEAIYLSDRVVVMAGHPGRIREIVKIDLPRPRTLATQGLREFVALREHVTAIVRDEVAKAAAFAEA